MIKIFVRKGVKTIKGRERGDRGQGIIMHNRQDIQLYIN